MSTREGQAFLALNGIQTQSAQTCNLLLELEELRELKVDVLRVSPQAEGTEAIIEAFAACLRGERDPLEAARAECRVAVWRLRRLLAGTGGIEAGGGYGVGELLAESAGNILKEASLQIIVMRRPCRIDRQLQLCVIKQSIFWSTARKFFAFGNNDWNAFTTFIHDETALTTSGIDVHRTAGQ